MSSQINKTSSSNDQRVSGTSKLATAAMLSCLALIF